MNKTLETLGLTVLISAFMPILPGVALEPGLYHGGGSRYIILEQNGQRWCYQGLSSNGVTTSVLTQTAKGFRLEKRGNTPPLDIIETSPTTFKFAETSNYTKIDQADVNSTLRQCLNSQGQFFEQQLIP